MMSKYEQTRLARIATEQALADARRRLDNVRYYINLTAPGAAEESANSHRLWKSSEAGLLTDIAELEAGLRDLEVRQRSHNKLLERNR